MADFETTTERDDCRIWSWFMVELGGTTPLWGIDMPSFFDELSRGDSIVYFHNLKFDGMFILDALFRMGFEHTQFQLTPKKFESLIDRMGKFYSIKIMWENGATTELRDSMKKLPFSVEAIAPAFGLEMAKGSIDYTKHRPVGYMPDLNELDYGKKDVLIVSDAMKSLFDQGMKKLTSGSDALNEFKKITGTKHFQRIFPVLNADLDKEIRLAYRGGYTYADPRYQRRRVGAGKVYDVNSLYPSVMYDRLLPYGMPHYVEGLPKATKTRPLFIVSVTFTAKIRPGFLPIIQLKGMGMFNPAEYLEEISEPVTLSFTNIDLELIMKHYDMDIISFNGGWTFAAAKGLFTKFIDKWSKVKNESEGALKQIAKLQLNSLYGKFASNPNVTPKIPTFNHEKNIVQLKIGDEDERDPVYTPMGVFITSYARQVMIRSAQANYPHFAYCDTDSMHLLTLDPPTGVEVHHNKLGAWKCEGEFDEAFYMRSKAYMEHMVADGKGNPIDDVTDVHGNNEAWSVHIAGVPRDIAKHMRFEDLEPGRVLNGKLQPETVPGGVVLKEVDFTLKF